MALPNLFGTISFVLSCLLFMGLFLRIRVMFGLAAAPDGLGRHRRRPAMVSGQLC